MDRNNLRHRESQSYTTTPDNHRANRMGIGAQRARAEANSYTISQIAWRAHGFSAEWLEVALPRSVNQVRRIRQDGIRSESSGYPWAGVRKFSPVCVSCALSSETSALFDKPFHIVGSKRKGRAMEFMHLIRRASHHYVTLDPSE